MSSRATKSVTSMAFVDAGFRALQLVLVERDVAALLDLEAHLDVVGVDLPARLLRHLAVADPRPGLLVQLVEVDVVVTDGGVRLHRHADQTEADVSAPDRSTHGGGRTRGRRDRHASSSAARASSTAAAAVSTASVAASSSAWAAARPSSAVASAARARSTHGLGLGDVCLGPTTGLDGRAVLPVGRRQRLLALLLLGPGRARRSDVLRRLRTRGRRLRGAAFFAAARFDGRSRGDGAAGSRPPKRSFGAVSPEPRMPTSSWATATSFVATCDNRLLISPATGWRPTPPRAASARRTSSALRSRRSVNASRMSGPSRPSMAADCASRTSARPIGEGVDDRGVRRGDGVQRPVVPARPAQRGERRRLVAALLPPQPLDQLVARGDEVGRRRRVQLAQRRLVQAADGRRRALRRHGQTATAVSIRRYDRRQPDADGHGDPEQTGEREDQRQPTLGTGAEPAADPVGAAPVGHERHEDALGDRPHEHRRQRRGRVLDELGEAEHTTLALERDRALQHRLLGRLDDRDHQQPDEHADGEQHDRRLQGERRADDPVDQVAGENHARRSRPEADLGDDEAADDERRADDAEQEAPRLHGHERQPVGVHEGHEHATEQVVERRQQDEEHQPGHGVDRLDRAADVDAAARPVGRRRRLRLLDVDAAQVHQRSDRQRRARGRTPSPSRGGR